eukprot:4553603-Pyramimonas_sp.AAC.1
MPSPGPFWRDCICRSAGGGTGICPCARPPLTQPRGPPAGNSTVQYRNSNSSQCGGQYRRSSSRSSSAYAAMRSPGRFSSSSSTSTPSTPRALA